MGSVNRHPSSTKLDAAGKWLQFRHPPAAPSCDEYKCVRRKRRLKHRDEGRYISNESRNKSDKDNNESANAYDYHVTNYFETRTCNRADTKHEHCGSRSHGFEEDQNEALANNDGTGLSKEERRLLFQRTGNEFVPWTPETSLDLEFAVECNIDDCDCMNTFGDRFANTVSLNTSNNTLALTEERDIRSRVRSMMHGSCDNEWNLFVCEHFANDIEDAIGDEYAGFVDASTDPTKIIDDTNEFSDNSFEIIEQDSGPTTFREIVKIDEFELYKDTVNENNRAAEPSETTDQQIGRKEIESPSLGSSSIELPGLEGFHTAPNSPQSESDEYFVIDDQKSTNQLRANKCTDNIQRVKSDAVIQNKDITTNCKRCAHCNKEISKNERVYTEAGQTTEYVNADKNATHNDDSSKVDYSQNNKQCNTNNYFYIPPNEQTWTHYEPTLIALETPPFISARCINYEGDPATGEVDVVGRGSFGIVYKARFSDPLYAHLPIVVKEFDEEFSNPKEIIEEAQRLYYLQDTGYVPVCYGILCYGPAGHKKYGIVQELIGNGLTLEQMLWDKYELPVAFWYQIVLQSCEGLAMFHEKGILLNDIKANNIILEIRTKAVRIKFIDFGLATDMRGKRYKNTKSLEDFLYLAPEVRVQGAATTIYSDIFSLGFMIDQIRKYSGLLEMAIVSDLCMDMDPAMRLPVRGAASLIRDQMETMGLSTT